jgi:hypothetical protein
MEKENKIGKIVAFSGVGLIFLGFIYFIIWRNIAMTFKNSIIDLLPSSANYEEVIHTGFPFKKTVVIKEIMFNDKNTTFLDKNNVLVGEFIATSYAFSKKISLEYKNIRIINVTNKKSYKIIYNEKPTIEVDLYNDYRLKSFVYDDNGYKVLEDDELLYTTDKMFINTDSMRAKEMIEYTIVGHIKQFKGIVTEIDKTTNIYDFNFNALLNNVEFGNNDKRNEMTLKLNNVDLLKNNESFIAADGEIRSGGADTKAFGKLNLKLSDYKRLLLELEKDTEKTIKSGEGLEKYKLSAEDKYEYLKIARGVIKNIIKLIEDNPSTEKDKVGFITLSREANSMQYLINNQNLTDIMSNILLQ